MKHTKFPRIGAWLLTIALLLVTVIGTTGCNLIEINQDRRDAQVCARIGDEVVTLRDFEVAFYNYWNNSGYGMYIDPNDSQYAPIVTNMKNEVMRGLIENKIKTIKARALGFMDTTQEDIDKGNENYEESLKGVLDGEIQEYTTRNDTAIAQQRADIEKGLVDPIIEPIEKELTTKWEAELAKQESRELEEDEEKIDVATEVAKELATWKLENSDLIDFEEEIQTKVDAWIATSPEELVDATAAGTKDYEDFLEEYKTANAADGKDGLEIYKEMLIEDATMARAFEQLEATETADITVTEDESRALYDTILASQRDQYTAEPTDETPNPVSAYETNQANYWRDGSPLIAYIPEGYRTVTHILIKIPETKNQAISALREKDTEADTKAADDMLAVELAKIADRANECLEKALAGDDFTELSDEYNGDPGMNAEPQITHGYLLGATSNFVESFSKAGLGLKNEGDITENLVASDFGYHIIKYLKEMKSGAVPYEDIRDEVFESCLKTAKTTAFNNKIQEWRTELKVKVNYKLYGGNNGTTPTQAPA